MEESMITEERKQLEDSILKIVFEIIIIVIIWIMFYFIVDTVPPLHLSNNDISNEQYTRKFLYILRNTIICGAIVFTYFDIKNHIQLELVSLFHQKRIGKYKTMILDSVLGTLLIVVLMLILYQLIIKIIIFLLDFLEFNYMSYLNLIALGYIIILFYFIYKMISVFVTKKPHTDLVFTKKSQEVGSKEYLISLLDERYLEGKISKEQYLKYEKEIEEME